MCSENSQLAFSYATQPRQAHGVRGLLFNNYLDSFAQQRYFSRKSGDFTRTYQARLCLCVKENISRQPKSNDLKLEDSKEKPSIHQYAPGKDYPTQKRMCMFKQYLMNGGDTTITFLFKKERIKLHVQESVVFGFR